MIEKQNTQYVLSLSYGKDSMACLGAIKHLGWPLDRIVTADLWATPTIPADPPAMVEFKVCAEIKCKCGASMKFWALKKAWAEETITKAWNRRAGGEEQDG